MTLQAQRGAAVLLFLLGWAVFTAAVWLAPSDPGLWDSRLAHIAWHLFMAALQSMACLLFVCAGALWDRDNEL